jgi:hypothetical protein
MSIHRASVAGYAILLLAVASYGQDKKPSVVLPEGAAKDLAGLCSRPGPPKFDSTWQPTETDVRAMESQLSRISLLQSRDVPPAYRIEHAERYFRQYVGIVVGKRKLIYINAFCINPPADWRKHIASACDGATCFWGVLYDTTTHEFSDLEINGSA